VVLENHQILHLGGVFNPIPKWLGIGFVIDQVNLKPVPPIEAFDRFHTTWTKFLREVLGHANRTQLVKKFYFAFRDIPVLFVDCVLGLLIALVGVIL